ncbi:MAG: DUF262 domain-containing protein [Muribaculaceae bacterium]|nr:DUF262 domain-containing protein [Muribaculaceae bacterium]
MSFIRIKTWVTKYLQKAFPDRTVVSNYTDDSSSKWYRHIQVSVLNANDKIGGIHYEFTESKVGFHFESPYNSPSYSSFRKYIIQKSKEKCPNLEWTDFQGHPNCQCVIKDQGFDSLETIVKEFERLMTILDPIINEAFNEAPSVDKLLTSHTPSELKPYDTETSFKREIESNYDVKFYECSFHDLMSLNLRIPSYQRNYCWTDSNIITLWDSMASSQGEIQLGNIILQNIDNQFDIIDGQQRLITLSLMAMVLGYQYTLPLLKEKIRSTQSLKNIASAKNLIKNLYQRRDNRMREIFHNEGGKKIKFGLLILGKNTSLDLAYTFFNSNNNKGIPLTDYDLLKAHHLQYIIKPMQAHHLASRWDDMVSQNYDSSIDNKKDSKSKGHDLKVTLGSHLLKLRKWMRLLDVPETTHIVKNEFIAAPIIDAIPPFGEKFDFYEKIQGGTHFFAYTENFVGEYKLFQDTEVFKALDQVLSYSSHIYYKQVIETLLFAYFLKFHMQYLPEAFFCITSLIADDRYSFSQMRRKRLWQHAKDSRMVMMIDQATSPTFFLAEVLSHIKINPNTLPDEDFKGRREQFYQELRKAIGMIYPLVTENSIKQKISEMYEIGQYK